MEQFLINITSYPTIIYTVLLLIVIVFWLLTVIGLFDMDVLELDIDIDVSNVGGALGVLVTLGLTGVPITLVISILILYGWTITSILVSLTSFISIENSLFMFIFNSIVLLLAAAVSIPLSAFTIRPLRKLFRSANRGPVQESLTGKTCRVRSTIIDHQFGEIECQKDGASLILNARANKGCRYKTDQQVVIIDYSEEQNTYFVVSEKEFNQ
ncbi:hypothetical protein [Psychromonas aquimarina]|uniref:hypothetical protein n=1 Tax=Psychromonas aquimarina TaxID=444919 RepID=UPI0004283F54|nr:hypothetical protein [Psychromonas aquimarina]